MSYRTGSLKYQVNQIFARGHAIGESKHAAKRERDTNGRVFAVRTDWDYRDGALYFARWARGRHGCHDIAVALRRPDWGHEWAKELAAQGKAASTRKAYLSGAAKACGIVAPSLRAAWTDVVASVGRRTPPPPRGYGADAERVLAAVGEASQEAMLILEVALATGARIGELVRTRRGGDHHLVPDRLLDARGLLLVGKGGLQRVVQVPEALYARLETHAEGKRDEEPLFVLADRDVQRELRDACHRLGLAPTGPHGLRYDFAARLRIRLVAEGWTPEGADREVSLQLGHRRPAITNHYLRGV